jgi:UDP-N-acetylmuramoyl-tripeptide--D-alanyl-D-alanine ligase
VSYINNRTLHDLKSAGSRGSTAGLVDLEMVNITALQVESSTGGILLSGLRTSAITGISINSRTLLPGDLFFAIRGPRNDGHDHIASALEKGACGVVVDVKYAAAADFPRDRLLLQVEDTHRALKDLAADVRRLWRGSLVAVTGSMGKTTAKEFATQVLQTEFSVYRSPGNFNNLFGLPLAIFRLGADDHIGIFELGMSATGEIAEMCRIARPDIGILTNVAPVHLEFFGSLEEIALAKGELVAGLPAEGTLISNGDDPLVLKLAARFNGRKISFGLSEGVDVRAHDIETVGLYETRFRITCKGLTWKALLPLAGAHYVMNTLPAIALADYYRIPMEQVIESLRHLKQTQMRGQILRFVEGFSVIDDSYNSNPGALMRMIEMLSQVPSFSRRILVAGEMLELGGESASLHRQCGSWAARCGIDLVVGVQGAAAEIVRGAYEGGLQGEQTRFFSEVGPAIDFVAGAVQPGDLVLIKGSRGVHLERVVEALRSRHEELAS